MVAPVQVFDHTDERGVRRRFCIPLIEALHRQHPSRFVRVWIALTLEDMEFIARSREIEPHRLREMTFSSALDAPGYACHFTEEDATLVVDGSHRMLRRYLEGLRDMEMFVCQEDIWHRALI